VRPDARGAAIALLAQVLDHGFNLGEAEAALAGSGQWPAAGRDRAFARHLAYGVLRWLSALEWLAGRLLRRPLKRRDRDVQRLILLGLFQLWQDAAPAHAAVHEAAEGARLLGKTWAVAVVNAVLRRFERERSACLEALAQQEQRHAHPDWLLQSLRRQWPEDWASIVAANNRPGPLWLRLRPGSEDTASAMLRDGGYVVTTHPIVPGAVRIEPTAAVEAIPGFAAGLVSVQDPAAQLAAGLLQAAPGQRVLDACAAPGSKTTHLLETVPDLRLTALDRSAQRLERVRENLARGGFDTLERVRLVAADATEVADWWQGERFQRILLDAPCTATGVIRRHPEIKWLRDPRQLREAVALQSRLLDALWPVLDAGGILLYATCSVLDEENSMQIGAFLARHADAEPSAIADDWGRPREFGRQILPGEQDMDGFFYARLRKR
jgi:16S rRNA (cytosine967-C5)-methyltransferase